MNRTASIASYCLFAIAAGACAVTMTLRPPEHETHGMVAAPQGTAYLDCAVVQRDRVPEPDLLPPCSMLA